MLDGTLKDRAEFLELDDRVVGDKKLNIQVLAWVMKGSLQRRKCYERK
jgi:hypothetical protein